MTLLRLLADDLTGALDTAAEFVGLVGPVQAFWHGAIPDLLPRQAALDSGTRELDPVRAAAIVGALTAHLGNGAIAFKKIDSLMRGPTLAELAACMRAGSWRHCVLAPAFPYQGRITRAGRQHVKGPNGDWAPIGADLIAGLQALGVVAQAGRLDGDLPPGVSVFAAETDDHLRQVVATVQHDRDQVLWSGTAGLAQAITAGANHASGAFPGSTIFPGSFPSGTSDNDRYASGAFSVGARADTCIGASNPRGAALLTRLAHPVLGLFGSDQPATAAQLAACAPHWTALTDGGPASAAIIARRLATAGIALASFTHPAATPRDVAGERIAQAMRQLAHHLDPPGSLIVAGGETLRALCIGLGATSLEVRGRITPGVPRSLMRGGRWDGVTVISKSGAFGHAALLRELLQLPDVSH